MIKAFLSAEIAWHQHVIVTYPDANLQNLTDLIFSVMYSNDNSYQRPLEQNNVPVLIFLYQEDEGHSFTHPIIKYDKLHDM